MRNFHDFLLQNRRRSRVDRSGNVVISLESAVLTVVFGRLFMSEEEQIAGPPLFLRIHYSVITSYSGCLFLGEDRGGSFKEVCPYSECLSSSCMQTRISL